MRKANNQIIFSASDLSNHIHCKHLTNLNYDVVQGLKEKPISNNKVLDVLRARGLDFENSFLTCSHTFIIFCLLNILNTLLSNINSVFL